MTDAARPLIVVMGVSGSGKSTIGARLARSISLPFIDADDLHPVSNVDRMAAGLPLTDADRWPWLEQVGLSLADRATTGAVIACSALRRSYRDAIRAKAPTALFVQLAGEYELLAARLNARENHFMPAGLLGSQLDTLEPLEPDEVGFPVAIAMQPDEIVAMIRSRLEA